MHICSCAAQRRCRKVGIDECGLIAVSARPRCGRNVRRRVRYEMCLRFQMWRSGAGRTICNYMFVLFGLGPFERLVVVACI